MPMLTDRERLILLNLIPDIGSLRLQRLVEAFGSLGQLWRASAQDLQQVEGIGPMLAQRVVKGRQDERLLQEELAVAQREGVALVTLADAHYPELLRKIHDPPLALYVRGTLPTPTEVTVAVVGSRRASRYGVEAAERLAYDLALRGVVVISGLARGVDAAAHRGALQAGGRTIGVLGGGFCRLYPPEHEALAREMADRGAVLSEYPMRMAPLAQNFPRRNRVISGLSRGVVIVEAAQRSGALITADCAMEQGRDVFAVPGHMGSVTSQGTHQLLKEGARLVTSVEDILEELGLLTPQPKSRSGGSQSAEPVTRQGVQGSPSSDGPALAVAPREQGPAPTALSEGEQRILQCLDEHEPRSIDAIAAHSGLALPEVASTLLHLELKHLVCQRPGQRFVRSA